MAAGTSDSTIISPIMTEPHNLNTTVASAAPRDSSSSANIHAKTDKTVSDIASLRIYKLEVKQGAHLATIPGPKIVTTYLLLE